MDAITATTEIAGILIGATSFLLLFFVGSNIKSALGESFYETFVFVAVCLSLWGASAIFQLLKHLFGDFWLFSFGIYAPIACILLVIVAKLAHIF